MSSFIFLMFSNRPKGSQALQSYDLGVLRSRKIDYNGLREEEPVKKILEI